MKFHMFKQDLEKAEEPKIKLPMSAGSSKKQESSRKTFIPVLLTMTKPLTVWITINWKILKDDAVKSCTQYVSKFGKLSSGHRTGKGQFSFQSQRKAMPKNAHTATQLHLSHMLVKKCLKFSMPGFSNT